jgi:hypothetical protein
MLHSFPSDRYARTNPLRRLFGLHLLAEPLPERLGAALIRAWMFPARYDGNQAIQSLGRRRLPEAGLPLLSPGRLGLVAQIELEVGRRIVEISRQEIEREERNALLRSQAAYLAQVYGALVTQVGEAKAQAVFERCLVAGR